MLWKKKEYVDKISSIREEIEELVNALWNCEDNKKAFTKTSLINQVFEDIRFGYEKE